MGLLHRPCQSAACLYGACMGPVYGLHGAVLRRLPHLAHQLQLAVWRCNGELTEPFHAPSERSLSQWARSVSAQCAIWRAQ